MNSNPYIKNEIRASTDEICYADEIFGYASDEIKSVQSPDEVGFHHEVISSHESGIYPVR